ncbi:hypothetical protein ACLB2K_040671 [Fragaria x ananassa]
MDEDPNHSSFFGHLIEDLPFTDEEDTGEQEDAANLDELFEEWGLPKTTMGSCGMGNGVGRSIRVDGSSRDRGKGKEKVVEVAHKRKVGRPKKRSYNTRSGGESSRPVQEEKFSSESDDSDDPNYDGFVDSDYELEEEDDEILFERNVDGNVDRVPEFDEMGYEGHISDEFQSAHESDSDGEDVGPFKVKGKKRFSDWLEFNEKTDMKNPRFALGMIFPNSKVFKHAVRKHAVLTKKELMFPRSTKHKVLVKCKTSPDCPFWLYASSPSNDNPTLQIRTFRPNHTCSSIKKRVNHCHAPFLAEEYKDCFMADAKWSREGIQNVVNRDFGMEIGYQLCYRAKNKAIKKAQGSIEDQYNLLEAYAHELKKKNQGSSVWIHTELEGEIIRFKRIYICLAPLREGWIVGCRHIIGLDGCHLKCFHKGRLLSAVGIDGNNGIYPISWAIVEGETRATWNWFLTFLREDLQLWNSHHYVFISDKQKGLEQVIKNLFPNAEHRHCVRHLHNNFKGDGHTGLQLKQRLWAVARATTINEYTKTMGEMAAASGSTYNWCMDRPAKHWSRSHFGWMFKCDILLNNHSESFNKTLLEARKKPIIPCLEDIRIACMVRLTNRRNSAAKWRCKVGPRIEKLLKKNASWANQYRALESSEWRFEIQGRGVACESGVISQHSVQLDTMSCTCRRYDLCGLPCSHAIAAIYSKGWSPDDYVAEWYTKKKYMQAYQVMLNPIAGVSEWEPIERKIAPPLYRRQLRRPKKNKAKGLGETTPPSGTEKLPRSFYSRVSCGTCNQKGHNARSCARRNKVNENVGMEQENVQEQVPQQNHIQAEAPNEGPQEYEAPLPHEESNFEDADPRYSQTSSMPNLDNHIINENENENVNLNVNIDTT